MNLTRREAVKNLGIGLPLIGVVMSQAGCSPSQVTVTLDLIVVAGDAALTALATTGVLTPATVALGITYLSDISTGVQAASNELASTDSAALKATKVAAIFAAIAQKDLPAGTPQELLAILKPVLTAIQNFLMTLPVATNAALVFKTSSLSHADKKYLNKIAADNSAFKTRLMKFHPAQ